MVKNVSRIIIGYSNNNGDFSDEACTRSGTVFINSKDAFNDDFIGILDKKATPSNKSTNDFAEQLIIGRIIKDKGMIFLILSNEDTVLNNSAVFTTLTEKREITPIQSHYEEIESIPLSQYKPYEPLRRTSALLTSVKLPKNKIEEISKRIKRWKANASKENLNTISGFEREISNIVVQFNDELDVISEWSLMPAEGQEKVLEKQSPDPNSTLPF